MYHGTVQTAADRLWQVPQIVRADRHEAWQSSSAPLIKLVTFCAGSRRNLVAAGLAGRISAAAHQGHDAECDGRCSVSEAAWAEVWITP